MFRNCNKCVIRYTEELYLTFTSLLTVQIIRLTTIIGPMQRLFEEVSTTRKSDNFQFYHRFPS